MVQSGELWSIDRRQPADFGLWTLCRFWYSGVNSGIIMDNYSIQLFKKITQFTLRKFFQDLINFNRYSSVFSLIGFASIWKQGLSRPHPRHLYSIGGDSHSFQIKLDAFCTLQTQFKVVLI